MMNNRQRVKKTHHRDDLTGEHAIGDAGQAILACLFFIVWIADTFFLKYTVFLNEYILIWIRILLAVVLIGVSGYLAYKGLAIVFGERRKVPGVIRKGVFGVVRHPIYLSEIMLYLAFIALSISLAAVMIWVIAVVFLHHISRYEERMLLQRFGEDYRQYMKDVPMWLPRLQWK